MNTNELMNRAEALMKDYAAACDAMRKANDKRAPMAREVQARGEAVKAEFARRTASGVRITTAATSFEARQMQAFTQGMQFLQEFGTEQARHAAALDLVARSALLLLRDAAAQLARTDAPQPPAKVEQAAPVAAVRPPRFMPSWR